MSSEGRKTKVKEKYYSWDWGREINSEEADRGVEMSQVDISKEWSIGKKQNFKHHVETFVERCCPQRTNASIPWPFRLKWRPSCLRSSCSRGSTCHGIWLTDQMGSTCPASPCSSRASAATCEEKRCSCAWRMQLRCPEKEKERT